MRSLNTLIGQQHMSGTQKRNSLALHCLSNAVYIKIYAIRLCSCQVRNTSRWKHQRQSPCLSLQCPDKEFHHYFLCCTANLLRFSDTEQVTGRQVLHIDITPSKLQNNADVSYIHSLEFSETNTGPPSSLPVSAWRGCGSIGYTAAALPPVPLDVWKSS